MLDFITSQILFYFSITIILFLPGYFLLLAIFGKSEDHINILEKFILSFGLSLIIIDALLILFDKFKITINAPSILISIFIFSFASYAFFLIRQKDKITSQKTATVSNYSKKQTALIILILFFSILIRSVFLSHTITPTGTDLGHHMYWAKQIIDTGKIPTYQKIDILEENGAYSIGEPSEIDDFIVGEHLVFAALALVSRSNVISAFPALILLLINIMGLLVLFVLAEKLFSFLSYGKNISLTVLFFTGALFALSGAQGNFVSGGVIGNLLGNFFIPMIFYFLFRGIKEQNSSFFSLGLISTFFLAYTHHLSTFIFIFSLAFVIFFVLLFQGKKILTEIKKWLPLLFSKSALLIMFFGLLFFFFVRMPGYVENQAVKTIIGEPSRSTKAGLSLPQLFEVVGESRAAIGMIGIFLLLLFFKKNKYSSGLILGWFFSIFIMSWKPTLLHIDIPSSRIGNYLIFPLILSGAFALNWLFFDWLHTKKEGFYLAGKNWFLGAFILLTLYISTGGFISEAEAVNPQKSNAKFIETFAVSKYLAEKTKVEDIIVKDHNYISADSWMKLFFQRDYNYPFTRGFFFRYEGAAKREMCTLWMISEPKSSRAQKCFAEIGVDFIVINPAYDGSQFNNSKQFWKIYSSDLVETYYKSN